MTVRRLGKILLGTALVISSVAASASTKSHEIRKGDTLWVIAAKHNTTPREIAKANGISENATLKLGKVLRIPTKDTPSKSRAYKATPTRSKSYLHATRKPQCTQASNGSSKDRMIQAALECRGLRYRMGGVSRNGFDCSGFTRYIYAHYGVSLPHSSAAQAQMGRPVSRGELRAGDLVFFQSRGRSIGHVGLYIGNNQFVHAATYGRGVRVDSLSGYYSSHYRCARRVK